MMEIYIHTDLEAGKYKIKVPASDKAFSHSLQMPTSSSSPHRV